MDPKLTQLKTEAILAIKAVKDKLQLEELETKFLGRKSGEITNIMKSLKDLADDVKKSVGQAANQIKVEVETAFAEKKKELDALSWSAAAESERLDITQPALPKQERGHFHPVTLVQKDLENLFASMGFMVLDGPELESDYYNFTALNFPDDHPARDIMDTFYIKDHKNFVMRTHTSPVQVRAMQKYGAPLRAVVPGKCFRNESTDPRHEHTFYQLEGLVIDKNITFAHMKGVFQAAADYLYGEGTKIRMMPKYYPFVEPGIRGEVTCFLCSGKGCRVCKNSGWLEVMPGGMVHPNVLKAGNIDPNEYQGFAFGFGLTRLAMLRYGIEDIRLLESGNMKFLEQF